MGGNAQFASILFQRLARHRMFPPPASYIWNRSAETGRPTAAAAKSIAYRYAGRRSQVRTFPDHLGECPLQIGEWRENRRLARIEDDIPIEIPFGAVQTEGRPQPALNAVADHRSAQGLGNRESDSNACSIGFAGF